MTKPKKAKKVIVPPDPALMISLRIAIPRKAAWMTSGILTGSIATETIIQLLGIAHGG
jgi:hypothetical protein